VDDPQEIRQRKDEHLDIVLRQGMSARANGFDAISFVHCALPECDLDAIDLGCTFLGWRLKLPFLISAMTGGPARGATINRNLASAAQELGIPLAVGSQRVALEGAGAHGFDSELRRVAPSVPLLANFGGAQLAAGYGVAEAQRAVEMIGADALVIHLNALQEAVQSGGDRNWRGVLNGLERLARTLPRPVLVKEVGYGISARLARQLVDAGVAAIDVAGAGGTAWAEVEAARARSAEEQAVAEAFVGWGIPTPVAVAELRAACEGLPLIASGGIRHGVDAAKAIRLGANLVGQAAGVLSAAVTSADEVLRHFEILARQLRIACFCTGSPSLAALRQAPLTTHTLPIHNV
jgi:isopentenyl-diphosphate delta-isomerase